MSKKSLWKQNSCSEEQLKEILEFGIWYPSGTNSQPWRFDVLMGDAKDEFIAAMRENIEKKKGDFTEQQINIFEWSALSLARAADEYMREEMDLIAAVGVGYPSAKIAGKKGPPKLTVDEVAEFRS